ncbi:MAG: tRNA (adenosine(37)-N6)-threonylcarbamoyltransferase complex dimerization subunit type 1 TsaB [Nitrosomonas sp.]|nr:tRNA (adenosine(37)-N6)-threonylcarbamoyltransferase complex dimerization subunit type 1 TsaB [Nitrosomonas sp.]
MNIIAIDASTAHCSLALWQNGTVNDLDEYAGQRHSELLLPMLQGLLDEAGLSLGQIDGIAYGAGPGAFTGLRIACGVAQGLAFAHDIPVVGIITLEALAQQADAPRVLTALDARMGELYFAAYTRTDDGWLAVHAPMLISPASVPAVQEEGWVACGSGFDAYAAILADRYTGHLMNIVPDIHPRGREIAHLAAGKFMRGEGMAAEHALPVYLRDKVALKESER